MSFLDVLGAIFKPISDVINHVTMSGDEKAKLQETLLQGQIAAAASMMDYEKQLLQSQSDIIKAEAQGGSWLQRSWRPITMLTFLALVVGDALGYLPNRLAPQAWTLLQIGIGGYTVGRSVEKVAPLVVNAIKGDK